MDLWKGYELSRTYVPAAYYTITSIKSKNGRANACTETGLCLIPTPAYPFVEMPSGYFAS